MAFSDKLKADAAELNSLGRLRTLKEVTQLSGGKTWFNNQEYFNLSGNDYMGINSNLDLHREFWERYRADFGNFDLALSSASSRLLTGNTPQYVKLESALSKLYCGRSALVFNSGYHANIGILPALVSSKDLILSDKLNHASIIDGLRLSDCDFKRYHHCDMEHLERLLKSESGKYNQIFIITESIFSMDGDAADLEKMVELKKAYGAFLIVDEAHAVGVFGAQGGGMAEAKNLIGDVDIIIGTFGKAFGSTGAYGIMNQEVKEYLINHMRPFIFTTGLPPVILSWSNFVLEHISKMEEERKHLLNMAAKLRDNLQHNGLKSGGVSQIVPLIVGTDTDTNKLADKFMKQNILVFPIRPPTVPQGTSRLRFSLSAALDMSIIERIIGVINHAK